MSQAPLAIVGASCCNKVIYGRFRDYAMFGGRMVRDREEQSAKEVKRIEKRTAEEAGQLAKEQAWKKVDVAREQAIAEAQKARKLKAKKQPPE